MEVVGLNEDGTAILLPPATLVPEEVPVAGCAGRGSVEVMSLLVTVGIDKKKESARVQGRGKKPRNVCGGTPLRLT